MRRDAPGYMYNNIFSSTVCNSKIIETTPLLSIDRKIDKLWYIFRKGYFICSSKIEWTIAHITIWLNIGNIYIERKKQVSEDCIQNDILFVNFKKKARTTKSVYVCLLWKSKKWQIEISGWCLHGMGKEDGHLNVIIVFVFVFCYSFVNFILLFFYTAGSYQLSILYILVYTYQSQSPNSSHHPHPHPRFPRLVSIRLFSTSVSLFLPCKPVHLYHFLDSTYMC